MRTEPTGAQSSPGDLSLDWSRGKEKGGVVARNRGPPHWGVDEASQDARAPKGGG